MEIVHETYQVANFDDLENKLEQLQKKRDLDVDIKTIKEHNQFGTNLTTLDSSSILENLKNTENYKIVLKSDG